MTVVVIVADGARPDMMQAAMDDGSVPTLSRLRDEGGFHTITSAFPSVTGPAYTPFLMGRFPGPVGLPGLRWYDRTRTAARLPGNSRSYVGLEMRLVDKDLDPEAPTMFELVPKSIAALNVINRGLPMSDRIGRGPKFVARAARTHFRGNVRGWLSIDRDIGAQVADHLARKKPDFVFAALTGIDKTSHSQGHNAPVVREALQIVDETVERIRNDAEIERRWNDMQLWVVSDHGHSPVLKHEDLIGVVRSLGLTAIAHPWVYRAGAQAAVMVSGNAMAHIYLDIEKRDRPFWSSRSSKWDDIASAMLARPSVDLMILPLSTSECEVHARNRGHAQMSWNDFTVSYEPMSGDPIGIGKQTDLDAGEAYEATIATDYPDSLIQIARLVSAPRSGEIILSASRNWDYRSKYEPIPHVSSHGALHRDHMLVPLLTNHPVRGLPRRTVDVMPSALEALGIGIPGRLDGESFY